MLSIGEFARHARVSVRMLRHYDHLGLLVPAQVDPGSGYRSYTAAQLTQVNRLVALKDLGFTLEQIRPVLLAEVGVVELRAMLQLRHAQLAAQISTDTERLSEVERRLRSIEKENTMSDHEFVLKALPSLRLAQRSATVHDHAEVGPVIGPLFGQLAQELAQAGLTLAGVSVATYTSDVDGAVSLTAGFPVAVERVALDGVEVVDLDAQDRAVTLIHHGSMATIGDSWQALYAWIEQNGHHPVQPSREYYLETPLDRPDDWVTELQQPLR